MPSFSRSEVILVRYPFSDLSTIKIRPAVIIGLLDRDYLIVPLTSNTTRIGAGEFVLSDWQGAGLNVPSAVKQGIYTVHASLIVKSVGCLSAHDTNHLEQSLREWLQLR